MRGGRSLVRKAAGIEFPGWDPTISHLIAEVELAEEPDWGTRRDALGLHGLSKMEDGKTVRVMVTEQRLGRTGEPTLGDLSEALIAVYGTDYGVHSPISISRFTDMARQVASCRKGLHPRIRPRTWTYEVVMRGTQVHVTEVEHIRLLCQTRFGNGAKFPVTQDTGRTPEHKLARYMTDTGLLYAIDA